MKHHYRPGARAVVVAVLLAIAALCIAVAVFGASWNGAGKRAGVPGGRATPSGPKHAVSSRPSNGPPGGSAAPKSRSGSSTRGSAYAYYSGPARKTAYAVDDQVAVFFEPGAKLSPAAKSALIRRIDPGAKVAAGSSDFVMFVATTPRSARGSLAMAPALKAIPGVKEVSPVFADSASPANDTAGGAGKSALTGEIVASFDPATTRANVSTIASKRGLRVLKHFDFAPGTYLLASSAGPNGSASMRSLSAANELQRSGAAVWATPNWLRVRAKRAVPNDTLFNSQWHLANTGQGGGTAGEDIDVQSAWDTYKGSANEVIAIVDDGMEIAHEDLSANTALGGHWDWVGNDSNPTPGPADIFDDHGTACSGVAAARGFNALGVSGSAPQARLIGHRMLGADSETVEAAALSRSSSVVDIYSNSWGPLDDRHLEAPPVLVQAALANGAATGRGGKGNIYVWAAGNGGDVGDDANFDGYANSRHTIAVAASDNFGERSYYSETGANLLVNAPSSGDDFGIGITTTDRTGDDGYALGNYTNDFGGTSSAAPLVSGVTALILQANPNLGWRDVQQILAVTADKNDPTNADWTANGAGYHVNHNYGFGRVNASAAASVASTWTPVGQEESVSASAAPGLAIPDDNTTGVSSTLNIVQDLRVERVDVTLSVADHSWWNDLEVTLTSPSGAKSVLGPAGLESNMPGDPPFAQYSYNNWRFGSTRHLGESSSGAWTLTVKDLAPVDTGTFQSWGIKIYGTQPGPWGTFAVNNNATYTTTATVSLDSTIGGATEMRVRNSGDAWPSTWDAYSKHVAWTLPAPDGAKSVEVEFRGGGVVLARSDSIILDTAPPSGAFSINGGAASVATATVSLDPTITGAAQMRFRNSGGAWSAWQAYAQHKSWALAGLDGAKTVDGEFRDTAGNVLPVSDSITLERAPDAPTPFTAVRGDKRIDLAWRNPSGDFALTRILRSVTAYATSPTATAGQVVIYEGTGQSMPDRELTNGTRYYYRAFALDVAGNWSTGAIASTVPAAPTALTATAQALSSAYGTGVRVSGPLMSGTTALTGRTNVAVWRSSNGTTWTRDTYATWNATSRRYEAVRTITGRTYFQLRYGGEAAYQPAVSGTMTAKCKADLPTPWLSTGSPARGAYFTVYGYLRPRHAGATKLVFYRKVSGVWRQYGTTRYATNRDYAGITRYQFTYRVAYGGQWYVRAFHSDADHLATQSPARVFTVR